MVLCVCYVVCVVDVVLFVWCVVVFVIMNCMWMCCCCVVFVFCCCCCDVSLFCV